MRRFLAIGYWLLAVSLSVFAQSNVNYSVRIGETKENLRG